VVGAGMGGLAAAGAIAQHFEQVVVVERDALPAEPTHRPGIPQGQHPHGLLISGQRALGALFPDFEQDLVRAGTVPIVSGLDLYWENPGYDPFPRRDLGLAAYALSRPAIEHAVRRRVEGLANVRLRQRCRVEELLATPDGATVTGVRCDNGNGSRETLEADLVIDASGRGALTLALLKSIGRPLTEETTIGVDLGYATCVFAIPDDAPTHWKGVMTFGGQAQQSARGGLIYPLEGNRWMANLGGRHGDDPPATLKAFWRSLANCGRRRSTTQSGTPSLWAESRATAFPRACSAISSASRRSRAAFCQPPTQSADSIPFTAKA
jgi:2-polyprenyl-6-methoxyphenol hydroxylase-like FAD-dependent oxidoreductase